VQLPKPTIRGIGPAFFRSLVPRGEQSARGVPWGKIDISNPKRPRLRCRKTEL